MNDKFGRDERYRAERYMSDEFRRRRHEREPFWRGIDEDRIVRSPDQEFETSGNYREPREAYGETYSVPRERYRPAARYEGYYAPAYGSGSGWTSDVRGGYAGRGPKGYTRSDERIREDVCDRLSWNDEVDATDIAVRVEGGEVTLEGSVETRHMKRLAADLVEDVPG